MGDEEYVDEGAGDQAQDVHEAAQEYDASNDEGFGGYEASTVDPGPWMLYGTMIFCFGVMLMVVPCMVYRKRKVRKKKAKKQEAATTQQGGEGGNPYKEPLTTTTKDDDDADGSAQSSEKAKTSFCSILSFDQETRKILKLAIPYTISGLSSTTLSNICLAMIGRNVGTRAVAAYALVQILVALTDGVLYGPISACTTQCAHAVGAGNSYLAGQYIQIAITLYLLLNIPMVWFWWNYMEEVVRYLEWGDDETAALAEDFIRVYIWTYVLGGISSSLWQLLEVADHVVEGTVVSILWGIVNVIVVSCMVFLREDTTLFEIGIAYVVTSAVFVIFTFLLADRKGWIKPFKQGLFRSVAIKNVSAVKLLLKQAVPIGLGSLLSNAEWAVLTFFASFLGPAEVAAWAILGSIWDIFYTTTTGISDAGEIRVAHHFGQDEPEMARLVGYKALSLSMMVACVVSIIYFSVQDRIPTWFTVDETLQDMLREVVPFVGIANLTMQFGMTSWSLIGAQGKYKLATWVSFISSWGITMPLAALYCFVLHYDLKGITSAVTVGYVTTGASLSYVLLSTNWKKVARKIREANAATAAGEETDDKDDEDGDNALYASIMGPRSQAARMAARRNIRLLTLPSGARSGIMLGNIHEKRGVYVLMVREWSPLAGSVKAGDSLVALDGQQLSGVNATEVSSMLKATRREEREICICAPPGATSTEEQDVFFTTIAEDESTEAPSTGSYKAMSGTGII
mmetsp:Transcript_27373/g.40096  ORF Transcript_27373/g.40096 Transcript_27373/m.40096 type:complete len:740 (-) Transcript_27373:208-2427(-)|eukprot:CAMPEP_0194040960 /NCGR_PEP_ID=MMETSP0009_2-20130614/12880_1 /TAXON_ID=210454 /ORGANISM="Grammatophora oceanica, Strain CCMP 410" /LENGTH=739 /DNA_ID=CAMNT_0038684261 /DNA_START=46 /DNA_END=2265 /DNA_ORIENTATION=+